MTLTEALSALTANTALMTGIPLAVTAAFGIAAWQFRRRFLETRRELTAIRALIDNLSEGIYRSSLDGHQLSANPALVALNGYDNEAEMLVAIQDIATEWYVDPRRRDQFREILHREGHVEDFVSEIYRHKTRERIWITESARIVRDPSGGRPLYYEGSVREITETMRRLQIEELFQKLTRQLPGGLFQFERRADGQFCVNYIGPSLLKVVGIDESAAIDSADVFVCKVHPEDRGGYLAALQRSEESLEAWDHEFRVVDAPGTERWLRVTAQPEAANGTIIWHGYVTDISLRRRQAMEIEKLAFFDPLTNLPNRRLFLDRMASALSVAETSRSHGALIFIDLDNFKSLNDTKGHDVGDEYLVQVADRLRGCTQDCDTIARIGGDEFVLIAQSLGDDPARALAEAITRANQILVSLQAPSELSCVRHQGSASLGVVVYDGTTCNADELLKRADVAMYEAKAAGRNAVSIFDPASMSREVERFDLAAALREAIDQDHLRLHFQPQMDRRGRICASEALIRWYHPDHGIIKPDRFIPLAEATGLIKDLGRMVLEKGIATLSDWRRDPATADLQLSLNVSVQSFAAPDFVDHLEELIARHGVDPSRLTLEFTEHVMAQDHTTTAERMAALKALGIRFSLDDFGTGYSSIAYLKQLPFDEVKIDGSFVSDIATCESNRTLVRTILAMASTLGMTSVAEHVETAAQESFLRQFGCDVYQGFRYSAPLSPHELVAFARRNRAEPVQSRLSA